MSERTHRQLCDLVNLVLSLSGRDWIHIPILPMIAPVVALTPSPATANSLAWPWYVMPTIAYAVGTVQAAAAPWSARKMQSAMKELSIPAAKAAKREKKIKPNE
jgi:hypothetical protein